MTQKVILITGCSQGGIGDALARKFHDHGHIVIASARDLSKVEHLEQLGISVLELDVTKQPSIDAALKHIQDHHEGRLDILVNNAGRGYSAPILDTDLTLAREMYEINFFARVALVKTLSGPLIATQGTIVNIGSIGAYIPQPWAAMYHSSYGAIHQWNEILRLEMKPLGVKVVLIVTGAIETKFQGNKDGGKIQEGSRYWVGRESINRAMNEGAAGKFSDPEAYAETVVRGVLKESPSKRMWVGKVTTIAWFVSTFLWATAWDYFLPGPFGVTDFEKKLKEEEKSL